MAKSPSAWHDDARSRDAGHDEMQLRVLRIWQRRIADSEPFRPTGSDRAYMPTWCAAEFPLTSNMRGGVRIEGFADIAVLFKTIETTAEREARDALNRRHEEQAKAELERHGRTLDLVEYRPNKWWLFEEIKPVIHSAGAVMRQYQALLTAAERAGYDNFAVRAVVYGDDQKLNLLEALGGCFQIISPGPKS